MKEGDKIYCHSNTNLGNFTISLGTEYIIKGNMTFTEFGEMFCIFDDNGSRDYYSENIDHKWYYKKWFCNEKEYRKKKLEKINNVK